MFPRTIEFFRVSWNILQ